MTRSITQFVTLLGATLEAARIRRRPPLARGDEHRRRTTVQKRRRPASPYLLKIGRYFLGRRDGHAVRRARERVRGFGVHSASARSLIVASARSAARAATSSPVARAALLAMTAAVCSSKRARVSASRRERPSRWLDCARCDAEQKRVSLLVASKCAPQKWHVVEWVAMWTPIRKLRVGVKKR